MQFALRGCRGPSRREPTRCPVLVQPVAAHHAVHGAAMLDLDHLPAPLGIGTFEGLGNDAVETGRFEVVEPTAGDLHVRGAGGEEPGETRAGVAVRPGRQGRAPFTPVASPAPGTAVGPVPVPRRSANSSNMARRSRNGRRRRSSPRRASRSKRARWAGVSCASLRRGSRRGGCGSAGHRSPACLHDDDDLPVGHGPGRHPGQGRLELWEVAKQRLGVAAVEAGRRPGPRSRGCA